MAATLRIVDESEYGPEPRDIPVPHGATVTVRRHRQGADVVIEPTTEKGPVAQRFEPTERRLIQGMSVAFGMSGFAGLVLHEGDGREHHFSIDAKSLLDFIRLIDPRPQPSPEDGGAPHLRDMGATLVDKARARLLEAQADKLEREIAAEFVTPADVDRPFQADRWAVCSDSVRGTVTATARDAQGREIRIESAPDRARWLAEHLLSGSRHVELGEH